MMMDTHLIQFKRLLFWPFVLASCFFEGILGKMKNAFLLVLYLGTENKHRKWLHFRNSWCLLSSVSRFQFCKLNIFILEIVAAIKCTHPRGRIMGYIWVENKSASCVFWQKRVSSTLMSLIAKVRIDASKCFHFWWCQALHRFDLRYNVLKLCFW